MNSRETIQSLYEEVKGVRESIDQLVTVLDHFVRNFRDHIGELLQPTPEIAETITCGTCDAQADGLANAINEGWVQFSADNGPSWNFLGLCPTCHEAEIAEERRLAKQARGATDKPKAKGTLFDLSPENQ